MDLSNSLKFGLFFIWLFLAMLALSFGVVRHADCLAIILGEPYGMLILTLAVISLLSIGRPVWCGLPSYY
jgi:Ca2+:H+ antiporter